MTEAKKTVFISDFSDEALAGEIQRRMGHSRSFATFEHLKEIDPDAYMAVEMIAREVCRQRDPDFGEGWSIAHDDQHAWGEMPRAAACYAHLAGLQVRAEARARRDQVATTAPSMAVPGDWPWDDKWWKPKNVNLNLIRAGGLIAAEWGRWKRANIAAYVADKDRLAKADGDVSRG